MVLNNDKWDKKAKRNYMIKHGIKPTSAPKPKIRKHFVQNKFDEQNQSSSEEETEEFPLLIVDDSVQTETSTSDVVAKGIPDIQEGDQDGNYDILEEDLDSNTWRYKDLPAEEDDDVEYSINYTTVNSNGLLNLKNQKQLDKLSTSELLNLKLGKNIKNNNNNKDSTNSHIKILTEQEKRDFFELQEKANKMKHYQEIKLKFSDEQKEFEKRQRQNKVLDLTDKDSYNDRVLAKFKLSQSQTKNQITEQEFDKDLGDLLGSQLSTNSAAREKDVNELLSHIDKLAIPDVLKPVAINTHLSHKPTEEDEDFLNDLL